MALRNILMLAAALAFIACLVFLFPKALIEPHPFWLLDAVVGFIRGYWIYQGIRG